MRRMLAGLVLGSTALLAVAPNAGAADTEPVAPEKIELRCRKAVVVVERDGEVHRKLVIGCRWSKSTSEDFHAYRLVRKVDEQPRMIVFRSDNQDRQRFIDRRVRKEHEYTYRLVVVDDAGKVIGLSNKAVVTT
jgi:hypothetical protein